MLHVLPESLPELQRAFCTAIMSDDGGTASIALREVVVEAGLAADVRLDIYRNNTISNLCNALRADYPAVASLVGDEFFAHAARAYIAATPSTSGDINDYGDGFPEFIAALPALIDLPYLGDVASLELAWKQVFYAPAAEPIDLVSLAGLAPEHLGNLRFRMHPALRLVSSDYPVLQIWQANQPDVAASGVIDLRLGGERILLLRVNDRVMLNTVSSAEYAWLAALQSGSSLADAVDAAFAQEDSFEFASCLQRYVMRGAFTGLTLGEEK